MATESIVYGYIKTECAVEGSLETRSHLVNRDVLLALPVDTQSSFLSKDFFSIPPLLNNKTSLQSTMIHFGGVYTGIEYEWPIWLKNFESLLQKMYWHSVIVHLETELSGIHTFIWDSGDTMHTPSEQPISVRCEWQHEYSL